MRKLILSLGILFLGTKLHAGTIAWNDIPVSSYTDVGTGGPIQFSSTPIQFVGITVSSPSPNGYIAIYRSTSASFTADVGTQTLIGTDYSPIFSGIVYYPLFETRNTSYTYISKVGTAKVTYWFKCPNESSTRVQGICPGLTYSGGISTPLK